MKTSTTRTPMIFISMLRLKSLTRWHVLFCLLLLGSIIPSHSAYALSTRYDIASAGAPVGAASFCTGSAGTYSDLAVKTSCSASSTNTNTITWQWAYDGIDIGGASGTFVVGSGAVPAVTLSAAQANTIPTGTHTLVCKYTPNKTNCVGTSGVAIVSAGLTITVLGPPGAISGTAVLCVGSSTALTNSVAGGTWTEVDGTGTATVSGTGLVTGVTAGNATISYTTGCGTPVARIVTVNASIGAIAGPTSLCISTTGTLSCATTGGVWSTSNAAIATVSSSGVVTGVAAGSATISYTASSCTVVSPMVIGNTYPPLTVNASPGSYCSGGSSTLTAASNVTNYTVVTTAYAPLAFTASGTFNSGSTVSAGTLDDGYFTVSTPFDFNFYGTAITAGSSCYIGTNGEVAFGTGVTTTYVGTLPTTAYPSAMISVFGRDLNLNSGGSITYGTTGTAPNRKFTVRYNAVPDYNTLGPETGQLIIYEGTNLVELHITTAQATTHTIGLQNTGGTIAAVVPGQNNTATAITNSSWRFVWPQATSFTWTPATALSATTGSVVTATPAANTPYSVSASYDGCTATASTTVTVNATPAAITGIFSACTGATSTLGEVTTGGAWSSSNGTIASVNASGVVTGNLAGTAIISYTKTGCSATVVFSVNVSPGAFGGATTACTGVPVAITNAGGPGNWTSSNTAVLTIGATTGIMTGITTGTTIISYSNSCGTSVGTIVNVNQSPAPITGATGTCIGVNITLSDAVAGGTWSSSTPSVATINSSSGIMIPVATGNTTISYSLGNGCAAVTQSETIGALFPPIAVSASPTNFCSGGSSTLSASSTVTNYTVTSQTFATVPFTASGTYNSGTTPTGGTNDDGYYTITLPFAFKFYGTTYAAGTNIFLGTNGYLTFGSGITTTYVATLPNAAFPATISLFGRDMIISTSGSISYGTTGTSPNRKFVINYTAVPDYCAACTGPNETGQMVLYESNNEIDFNVTTAQASSHTFGVQNATATVFAIVPGQNNTTTGITNSSWRFEWPQVQNYTWSPATFLSATTGASVTASAVTATTTYTVSGTYSGCTSTATVTTSVNPSPSAIGGSASVCMGSTTTLTNTLSGGAWSSGNTGVATIANVGGNGVVTPVTAGTSVISYTALGCTATVVVTVNALPTTVTASGTGSFCGSATITAANGGSGTIYYQDATSGGTSTTIPSVSQSVSATGTYYFRAQSSAGCWGTQGSVAVTVNPLPATTVASGAGTFCGSTTITADNGSDGTMYFQGTTSGGTSVVTAATSQSVSASGTYYFRARSSAGCWGNEGSVTVTINTPPTIVTASGTGTFCGSTTVTAGNGGSGTIYYQGTTSGGTSTATPSVSQSVSSSGTYYFRARSAAGCWGAEGSVAVTINPVPATVVASGGGTFSGSTTITADNGSDGTIYFQGTTSGGTSTTTPSASQVVSATGIYYFRARSAAGCWGNEGSVSVTINPVPAVTVVSGAGTFCGSTTITASNGGDGTMYFQGTTSGGTSTATPSTSQSITSSGTYYFRARSSAGVWGPEGSAAVVINAIPATVTASGAGTFCGSTTITAANGGDGTMYFQGTTSGGTSTTTASASQVVSASGTYYFRAQSSAGCWSTQGSVAVVINAIPSAAPTATATICNGGTASLNAHPGTNTSVFVWSGTALSSATIATPTATPGATTIYSLTVSDGSGNPGCSPASVYTVGVTVNATPVAAPTNSGTICNGGTVNLFANPAGGATSFVWSGSMLSSAAVQNPSATPVATSVYSLTVSDGSGNPGCSPATIYTTSVTVNTTPAAAPSNNGYICNGGTVNLAANASGGATTFAWSGPSLSSSTISSPSATPTTTSVYSLTVSDGSGNPGCSPTTIYTTSVTVNSIPTAAPTNNSPICAGGTVVLAAHPAGGASAFSWSGPSLSLATDQNPSASPLVTTVYSLTVTDGSGRSGCSPSTVYTTTVSVNPTPAAAPTNNGYICNGGTVSLTAHPSGGATIFTWAGPNLSLATDQNPTATPTVTAVYSLTVSDGSTGSGCSPVTVYTTTVTVNATPVAAPVNDGYICVGGTVNLQAVPAGGANTYTWSGALLSSTTAQNPTAVPVATGVYSLMVSDGSTQPGCAPAAVYTTSVTVNNAPSLTSATNDGPICAGATLNLMANGAANVAGYSWTGPVVITNSTTATASVPAATTAANGTYTVTVNNGTGNGCSINYTTAASVSVLPAVAGITTSTNEICTGSSLLLTAGVSGGAGTLVSYNWSGPNSYIATTATGSTTLPITTTAASGVYSLSVTYTGTGCSSTQVASTAVTVNDLPAIGSIVASPAVLCSGNVLTLTGSGATGTGTLNSYNWVGPNGYSTTTDNMTSVQTYTVPDALASGVYSLSVTYQGTGCTSNFTNSAAVTVNAAPALFAMTGGGSYCAGGSGVNIGLSGSAVGVSYQLYKGAVATGSPKPGTGFALDYGVFTLAGTYSVVATDDVSLCTSNMSSPVDVTISTVPNFHTVTGGGGYCIGNPGVHIGLNGSDPGVTYQLYNGLVAVGGLVTGTGAALDFGIQLTAGNYTVIGNPSADCRRTMTGSATVIVNPLPNVYNVTGGGSYCTGGTGVHIGLDFSITGINYQLYRGATTVGAPAPGSGTALDFGVINTAGVYTVVATNPASTCSSNMAGSATVTVNVAPAAYAVSAGGSFCSGGIGIDVSLANSTTGVTYQLYNGAATVGTPLSGTTGAALDFGLQTAAGTYTVLATNTATGCSGPMTGSAVIVVKAQPVTFAVTGGGSYCAGGAGFSIGLGGSATGVDYQLYSGATTMGAAVHGTGVALDFGLQPAGTYTVLATNLSTGCTSNMAGSAIITTNPLPTIYAVTGGGSFCAGGTGVHIGIGFSSTGINYQLYNGAATVGSAIGGSNSGLDFGLQTAPGTYSVVAVNASTGCSATMSGTATVSVNALPVAYNVSGGGTYCAGGTGLLVNISNSTVGVNYQLYNGAISVGSAIAGTGASFSFGLQTTAGTYTVAATNATTGCANSMALSATINVNASPTAYSVTGGGTYCTGSTGVSVSLNNSDASVTYQLYNGSSPIGSPVTGTGSGFSFGVQTITGTYTVLGTTTSTSCTGAMAGSAVVNVNPLPVAYAVTGGGSYCSGGTGVHVGLAFSTIGINYQLYNGAATVAAPMGGSNSGLDFGLQTAPGTYTVVATNPATGCVNNMTGSSAVIVNSLPAAFTVSGTGSYCSGGTGVVVSLSGSAVGVNYQLYNGAAAVGSPIAGTNTAISFGPQTTAATYTVLATDATTGCSANMSGSATISINPAPAAFPVTGNGHYCAGGAGIAVGLSNSASGVSYQLYNGAAAVGSAVAGTNVAISFGAQVTAGTYSVLATIGSCTTAMTGTAVIVVDALPTVFSVTGGGGYCAGGSGAAIALNGSTAGVNYQLYRGATSVGGLIAGTNSGISFGLQSIAGTYSVLATNAVTGCAKAMSGSTAVVINALPVAYTVNGGGSYCAGGAGVHIGLTFSATGVNYQLYNGATATGTPVAGSGAGIDFGTLTTAGTYSVMATDATTGCSNNMSGSTVIVVNPVPTVYAVTGGGSYCAGGTGVHIGLSNSASGINYQLFNGAVAVSTLTAGTNSSIDFGLYTAASTYTVLATNPVTTCTSNMFGNAIVSINALPVAVAVTGGGSYCAGGTGVTVSLGGSATGINYQLFNGAAPVGAAVAGTGSGFSFGLQTAAGTYSVVATNAATLCTSNMTGSVNVSINPLPAVYTVTGGGSYCTGGSGMHVGLSGSASGVNYQLYNGAATVGSPVAGNGSSFDFGLLTGVGTYSVAAVNATTACTSNMSGTTSISISLPPATFTVTGGGTYCAGGAGYHVNLSNSVTGVNYQLYNGASLVGSPVAGTNAALDFGLFTAPGTYSVVATNATTLCTSNMTGTATIIVNALPLVYNVTGGGSLCTGGTGVTVALSGSNTGINYQLYNGASAVGAAVAGTNSSLSWGPLTTAGTYSVMASNATTACTIAMSGNSSVVVNALPVVYNVTGGGSYCAGGAGVHVNLSGSALGVNYQLYRGATAIGTPVAGTLGALDFGFQTAAGTYTVVAVNAATTCTSNMSGSAAVVINPLPVAYAVGGGGSYCSGGTGVSVNLANSENGNSYQLYLGTTAVGAPVSGTGSGISFGLQTAAGTYTVFATNTTTACTNNMTGSTVISVNPLPFLYTVSGGGSYCAGGTGFHVGLLGSNTGISYQLYNGAAVAGAPLAGTGAALDFGLFTAAGSYTVLATNTTTSCTNAMTGSVPVVINALPTVYAVTGGGSYCTGGIGLHVGLNGSASGVNYQLFNGATAVGVAMAGTGAALDFGLLTTAGTYSVVATNAATLCTSNMSGSTAISINALPLAYAVTGGGNYCSGGAGVHVGLGNSQSGVNYQLYNGSSVTGSLVAGTGAALDFGTFAAPGIYTVYASNGTTACTANMTGSATIGINPLPVVYNLTGGGAYCAGGTGLHVGLSGSASGISYQLYNGAATVGTALAGNGSPLDFGVFTTAATYSVVATNAVTSCTANMFGSATVAINPLPVAYTVTGGGSYCAGGAGVSVGLGGSATGISYQLYNGTSPVGTPVAGNNSAISFGLQPLAGVYSVAAVNSTTTCVSNMTGTVSVVINPLPVAYTITGGGGYCAGGAGVHLGLSNSTAGISYQLFNGAAASGSPVVSAGGAIDFGLRTTAGTYSVVATDPVTLCTKNMNGTTVVIINALPVVYDVTGGGTYCAGGPGFHVGLNGSDPGVSYQLYKGSFTVGTPVAGTGAALDFGVMTAPGSYSVAAVNGITSCSSNMNGSATVIMNALPVVYTMTGGGNYCAGGAGMHVVLNGSETGVNYQLYYGAATSGSAVAGTGSAIDFGAFTTAGNYSVVATSSSSCVSNMSGVTSIGINALPAVFTVTGGGSYCAGGMGVAVGLSGSSVGVNYQLYTGTTATGTPVAGTGSAFDFGTFTSAGTYTVFASNSTTACVMNMSGSKSVIINAVPAVYAITGGGSYCNGGTGITLGTTGSENGISYQLYNGAAVVATLGGTGSILSFGAQSAAGTYTVRATNTGTGCFSNMTGTSSVSVNSAPAPFTVYGAGSSYCAGGIGVDILMTGSTPGISYQLFNGTVPAGSAIAGIGGTLNFGYKTAAGNYSAVATDATTGCVSNMPGIATVIINPLPAAFVVTGGGSYCTGGNGVHVGLSGSAVGVNYQLYNGTTVSGTPLAGNGGALDFGLKTTGGIYTVVATNATTGCVTNMSGSVSVTINLAPASFAVSGGGSYCEGGTGMHVGLTGSATSVAYQLYNGAALVGAAVSGTGSLLDFGLQATAGTYTVAARDIVSGCTNTMGGSAVISTNPLPALYAMTGGGSYCIGGNGVHLGLANSASGVSYQLYFGTSSLGTPVAGTGAPLDFGLFTSAGTYTVRATNPATGCTRAMPGSTVVIINSLPDAYTVSGGGSYCDGGSGVTIGMTNSATGVSYQLYNGTIASGTSVAGTGGAIGFGLRTAIGTYTVVATNNSTACSMNMTGSASVSVNPLITASVTVTSGSGTTVCAGTPVTFTADAVNGGTSPAYKWFVNGAFSGATAATFNYIPANGDLIRGMLISSATCATPDTVSAAVAMVVNANVTPSVTINSGSGDTVCAGTVVTFTPSPVNGGSTPAYVWTKNGMNVGSGDTYTVLPANGDNIVCKLTSNANCLLAPVAVSNTVTMTVDAPIVPSVEIVANPGTVIAAGQDVTFTAHVTNGGLLPLYQWYVNGVAVPGAVTSGFMWSNLANNDSVTCSVTGSSHCGGLVSFNTVIMTVKSVGVVNVHPANMDVQLVPNPNKGEFILKGALGSAVNEDIFVEVTDMIGQVVYKSTISAKGGNINERINLGSNLANGMYLLNLRSEKENKVFHMVVEQ